MKTEIILLVAALALAGCASNRGRTSADFPRTDFGRGGNRANPSPYDTESGAFLPQTDGTDLYGMESGKSPPPNRPPR